jgi:hypothetical protein
MPAPPGYAVTRNPRSPRIVGGAVALGVGDLVSAAVGAGMLSNGDQGGFAFIPVVGPFVALGGFHVTSAGSSGVGVALGMQRLGEDVGLGAALVVGGIAQTVGGILLAEAFTQPRTKLVVATGGFTLRPIPLCMKGSAGFGVCGGF